MDMDRTFQVWRVCKMFSRAHRRMSAKTYLKGKTAFVSKMMMMWTSAFFIRVQDKLSFKCNNNTSIQQSSILFWYFWYKRHTFLLLSSCVFHTFLLFDTSLIHSVPTWHVFSWYKYQGKSSWLSFLTLLFFETTTLCCLCSMICYSAIAVSATVLSWNENKTIVESVRSIRRNVIPV